MRAWPTATAFAVSGLVATAFDARNVDALAQAGLGVSASGLALAGAPIGTSVGTLLAPVAVARWGSRSVATVAGVLYAVAVLVPATAHGLWSLCGGLALLGASNGGLDVALSGHADAVEQRRGSRRLRLGFEAALSGGWIAGGVAGAAGVMLGWSLADNMAAVAAVGAACVLIAAPWLGPGSGREWPRARRGTLRAYRGLPARAWMLGGLAASALLGEGVMLWWSGSLVQRVNGLPALGVLVFAAGMAAGQGAGHLLRLTERVGPVRLVRGGAVVAVVGAVVLLASPSWPVTLAGIGAVGVGLSPANALAVAESAHLSTYAVGLVATVGMVGMWAAAPVVGGVAAVAGLVAAPAVLLVAVVAVVALAGALRAREERSVDRGR